MKYSLSTFFILIFSARITQAQIGPISLSLDVTKPTNTLDNLLSFGFGASVGYEDFLSEQVGLIFQIGATRMPSHVAQRTDTLISYYNLNSYGMLHAQLGVRYFFTNHYSGWYGMFQVGASRANMESVSYNFWGDPSIESFTNTSRITSFSLGYKTNRRWEYSMRFNSCRGLGTSFSSRFIALRISRTLFGDRQERP